MNICSSVVSPKFKCENRPNNVFSNQSRKLCLVFWMLPSVRHKGKNTRQRGRVSSSPNSDTD